MKTFFTLVATGLLVVLVIQMAVEFRPEHMCVIRGLVVFLGGTSLAPGLFTSWEP